MSVTANIGLVQLCASDDPAYNLERTTTLIRKAADQGAGVVMTPEMTGIFQLGKDALLAKTFDEESDPALAAYLALAKELGIWLLIGSLAIKIGTEKLANRSYLISPSGIEARYDKIHMFDVDLPSGESYRESSTYQAGENLVTAKTPFGVLGLSICYDLRFAYLFRALAKAGAQIITVPSGFTKVTGEAHWHTLLRARAIETGCFILAPAQAGMHTNGRETYGHTLAVDPWGEVLLDAGPPDEAVHVVQLDLGRVKKARAAIPALQHDRTFGTTET